MKFPKFLKDRGFQYVEIRNGVRYYQLLLEIPQKINVTPHGFPVRIEQMGFVVAALTVAKKVEKKKNVYWISMADMMKKFFEAGPFNEVDLAAKLDRFLK